MEWCSLDNIGGNLIHVGMVVDDGQLPSGCGVLERPITRWRVAEKEARLSDFNSECRKSYVHSLHSWHRRDDSNLCNILSSSVFEVMPDRSKRLVLSKNAAPGRS